MMMSNTYGPQNGEDSSGALPEFVHDWEPNKAPPSPEDVQDFFGRSPEVLNEELRLLVEEGHAKILKNTQEEQARTKAKNILQPSESNPPTPPTGKKVKPTLQKFNPETREWKEANES